MGHLAAEPNAVGVSGGHILKQQEAPDPPVALVLLDLSTCCSCCSANVLRAWCLMTAWEMCCLRSWGMHVDQHSISASGLNFSSVSEERDYFNGKSI